MYIDVTQLEDEELCIEHQYDEQFDLRDPSLHLASPPSIQLRLRRVPGNEVRVQGRLWVSLEAPCDRCLAHVSLTMDIPFDVFYAPIEVLTPEEDVPLSPKDLAYGFYRDNLIDIDGLVREQTFLALPFRRLCRPDCKGLCPNCGADLNEGLCACEKEAIAPYWSALRDLRKTRQ